MFFFQAEDGIRALVRSRGLGDVYKRQRMRRAGLRVEGGVLEAECDALNEPFFKVMRTGLPVSYTHLTLPTSDLV